LFFVGRVGGGGVTGVGGRAQRLEGRWRHQEVVQKGRCRGRLFFVGCTQRDSAAGAKRR